LCWKFGNLEKVAFVCGFFELFLKIACWKFGNLEKVAFVCGFLILRKIIDF